MFEGIKRFFLPRYYLMRVSMLEAKIINHEDEKKKLRKEIEKIIKNIDRWLENDIHRKKR
jgi:hypothetical protein